MVHRLVHGRKQAPSSQRFREESEGVLECSAGNKVLPLIELKLSTADVARVLNDAPSLEVRGAWLRGAPVANAPRRLLLRSQTVRVNEALPPTKDSTSDVWEKLHTQGMRWWYRAGEKKGY